VRDGNGKLPDVILIDGGKGQLSAALEVMDELQIADILILAISKGKERKPGKEQIWSTESKQPISMQPDGHLHLQHIRDEAHRFAVLGHRSRRNKSRRQSTLECIPGVGARRRSNLLKHFGGMQGLNRAATQEICKVPGISPAMAREIYFALHGTEEDYAVDDS